MARHVRRTEREREVSPHAAMENSVLAQHIEVIGVDTGSQRHCPVERSWLWPSRHVNVATQVVDAPSSLFAGPDVELRDGHESLF